MKSFSQYLPKNDQDLVELNNELSEIHDQNKEDLKKLIHQNLNYLSQIPEMEQNLTKVGAGFS